MRVLVTVQSFLTEKCCDRLYLYDGNVTENKDLIIELSGRREPNENYTTFNSNIMVLVFTSDSAGEYEGFNFTFDAIDGEK
uniref:CUB domain-containing protein n=1 Tax=Panagrolaimus davidi TaxID=227884 RepID=A0A914Q527_9BILA